MGHADQRRASRHVVVERQGSPVMVDPGPPSETRHTHLFRCVDTRSTQPQSVVSGRRCRRHGTSTRLEMHAILLALQHWSASCQERTVLICCDNLSCVHYINQQGGIRSPLMMRRTGAVLAFAQSLCLTFSAVHVRGCHAVTRSFATSGG